MCTPSTKLVVSTGSPTLDAALIRGAQEKKTQKLLEQLKKDAVELLKPLIEMGYSPTIPVVDRATFYNILKERIETCGFFKQKKWVHICTDENELFDLTEAKHGAARPHVAMFYEVCLCSFGVNLHFWAKNEEAVFIIVRDCKHSPVPN